MSQINIDFKFDPRIWQKKAFALQKRFTVLAVHRRAGKTTLAVSELIVKALQETGNYVYIAPEKNQARMIVWDMLKNMLQDFTTTSVQLVDIHESEPYVKFWNGSKIYLFGADKPDRIRGFKISGIIVDEVAQMPREIWGDVVRPALMDTKGWALFIGTPKGFDLFSELYEKGNTDPNWASASFTCYETDALDAEEIESYKNDVSDDTFRREMLCDFSASGSDQLISMLDVKNAARQIYTPNLTENEPLILGVDVARFGGDRSVLIFRRGYFVEEPIVLKDCDTVALAGIVASHCKERQPDAVFVDGTGLGIGVVDTLNSWGFKCMDINFGQRSSDGQYFNKRTEMWCKMAIWIRKGGVIPNNPQLVEEIATPTYEVNENHVKILESKKKIKERTGKSPDLADALALTFSFDIAPKNPYTEILGGASRVTSSANPFERFERNIRNSLQERMKRVRSYFYGRRY